MWPKLIDIGPLSLNTYGLALAIAFLFGLWLTAQLARREGLDEDTVWNIGLVIMVSGLAGSKLLMLLVDWDYYRRHPSAIFSLSTLQSGGVYYGGLLLALAACAWYFRRRRLPAWKTADLFTPGLALGHAIGRLGCLAAGCCYGRPTDVPWAIVFENPLAHEQIRVPLRTALHPTQLYEAAWEALLFGFLLRFRRRKSFDGQLVLLYLALYAVGRFVMEFYRGDDRGLFFGGRLSTAQLISLALLPAALAGLAARRRHKPSAGSAPVGHAG